MSLKKKELIGSFFDLQLKDHDKIKAFHEITHSWHRKKPTWILFMLFHLLQFDENPIPKKPEPMLDVFLANEANRLGKGIESIESPTEQCNPLFSMDDQEITLAIEETLNYLMNKKRHLNPKNESMLGKYLCGDLDETIFDSTEFLDVINKKSKDLINIQKRIHEDMIIRRNERMAKRIHDYIIKNQNNVIFVAIGAGIVLFFSK